MAGNGIAIEDIADLVASVQSTYPFRGQIAETQKYSRYVGLELWKSAEETLEMGKELKVDLRLKSLGVAEKVQMWTPLNVKLGSVVTTMTIPSFARRAHWVVNRKEIAHNMGRDQVFNILKTKRAPAMEDFANQLEEDFWSTPTATTDTLTAWGIKFWMNPLADGQAGEGFYGTCPSGWEATGVGGVLAGTANHNTTSVSGGEPRHRNWAAGGAGYYTGMDLEALDTMAKAAYKTEFMAPGFMGGADNVTTTTATKRIFTDTDTAIAHQRIARAQNDRLNAETAAFSHNGSTFMGRPVEVVQFLDADSARAPILMVPMDQLTVAVLPGDNMYEGSPIRDSSQPDGLISTITLTYTILMRLRQRAAYIRKTAD